MRAMRMGLAAAVLMISASTLTAQAVKVKEDKPGLLKKAKVTAEAAMAAAQAKFPTAKITSAEIEEEDGTLIFSFDLKTAGKAGIDEVNVDAMTGKVLKTEHESPKDEAKEAKEDKAKSKSPAAPKKPA